MKRLFFVGALALALAACSPQQEQQVQTVVNTAEQVAQTACAAYAPVSAALAAAPAGSGAAVTKGYIDGACDIATGQLTAAGLSNLDASTAAWISAGTAALKVLSTATAAPVVAPAAPAAPAK